MQKAFLQYIDKNKLFSKKSKVIIAVSGGVDSMVMTDLFIQSGYDCCIAHCNFSLRGAESDADELLVKETSKKYKIPFHTKRFDTEAYSKEKGISIQMTARDVRYEWFNNMLIELDFDYIAIAHNKNDIAETFFLNLTRGTGLKGLTGIKNKTEEIVRPLLFASRKDIEAYAKEKNIEYREDSSNSSLKYSRNRIRNKVIPELNKINTAFDNSISNTINHINDAQKIIERDIEEKKELVFSYRKELRLINIKELNKLNPSGFYLFNFLSPFGFNASHVNDIIDALATQAGKMFYSDTHMLVKDRQYLIIQKLGNEEKEYFVDKSTKVLDVDIRLEFKQTKIDKTYKIDKSSDIAQLDASKIKYPLRIRKWKDGDRFIPLGMKNFKKLSDFFADNKLSIIDKKNTWIIESNSDIVWIAGMRIDNRYKIDESTTKALIVKIK